MTDDEQIQRAERARQLLNDPFIQEALSALELATINKMKLASDDKARLRLIDFLQAVELFKQYFIEHLNTGKMVEVSRLQRLKKAVGF